LPEGAWAQRDAPDQRSAAIWTYHLGTGRGGEMKVTMVNYKIREYDDAFPSMADAIMMPIERLKAWFFVNTKQPKSSSEAEVKNVMIARLAEEIAKNDLQEATECYSKAKKSLIETVIKSRNTVLSQTAHFRPLTFGKINTILAQRN
jgi:hypothetical protein